MEWEATEKQFHKADPITNVTCSTADATGNTKKVFEQMLVMEIFAGSSNLSVEIRKANLRAVAVDKTWKGLKDQSQFWI